MQEIVHKLPLSPWHPDPYLKDCGRWYNLGLSEGLEAFTLGPMTRVMGWSADEVKNLLIPVQKDINSKQIHAYHNMYVHPVRTRQIATNASTTGTFGLHDDRHRQSPITKQKKNRKIKDSNEIAGLMFFIPRLAFSIPFINWSKPKVESTIVLSGLFYYPYSSSRAGLVE